MPRLSWKFIGALILVVIVSVFLMAFLISQSTVQEFRQYVTRYDIEYAQQINAALGQYYNKAHGWNGVQNFLGEQLQSRNDRIVMVDDGKIIADTGEEWVGKNARELGLNNSVQVNYSGQKVGEFYLISVGTGGGYCNMEGRGCGPMTALTVAEQNFVDGVNSYLWIAGAIAAIVALFLGVLLTRQIILPVRDLTAGAREIAKGNLNYRVRKGSNDELGALGQSFNSMASSLDKLEQSRKRLTADITHELRTPLTVIEGTTDAILDGVYKPDREHLETIREQTALLNRLISDLREISSAESGQLKLNITATDMGELLHRKAAQMEVKALGKGIKLGLNLPQSLPEVQADTARIEQAVANLIINAIRHTPQGGTITISAEVNKMGLGKNVDEKNGVIISVADTGEGIPADHLPYVFDRFYRVDASRYKNEGEVGLGLAIVKQMVLAHGGDVWAKSTHGQGSTFYIRLPIS